MRNQGFGKDSESQGTIIYKVTEFYDYSSYDPELISTIFFDKELAISFFNQRIKEIPKEIWGYDDKEIKDWVSTEEGWGGSTYLTNNNDHVNVFLEEDRVHVFPHSELWSGD